ncbi:MAG: hypothetical protein IAE91_07825 [Ignavibacteriaceae bacterium]|nr:hypothetical protein [Ignavibacteriaceae bacterium]
MTNTEMLNRVRSFLDETVAGFWSDEEIYSGLTAGQTEIVNSGLTHFTKSGIIPGFMKTLETSLIVNGVSGISFNLPGDFLHLISLKIANGDADREAVYLRETGNFNPFTPRNFYLKDVNGTQRFALIIGNSFKIEGEGILNSGSYELIYIKYPAKIDAANSSILKPQVHESICLYAHYDMLKKDNRINESLLIFEKYKILSEGVNY